MFPPFFSSVSDNFIIKKALSFLNRASFEKSIIFLRNFFCQ
ncbi:hypothetical protein CLOM621_06056 [Clostridium sp. M62/1]|nr:hypothetical protein CLOM621_06056 [Clostridium sp. M62/1]